MMWFDGVCWGIFVADSIKGELVDAMVAESKHWKVGDPLDESINVGPQNNMGVKYKKINKYNSTQNNCC